MTTRVAWLVAAAVLILPGTAQALPAFQGWSCTIEANGFDPTSDVWQRPDGSMQCIKQHDDGQPDTRPETQAAPLYLVETVTGNACSWTATGSVYVSGPSTARTDHFTLTIDAAGGTIHLDSGPSGPVQRTSDASWCLTPDGPGPGLTSFTGAFSAPPSAGPPAVGTDTWECAAPAISASLAPYHGDPSADSGTFDFWGPVTCQGGLPGSATTTISLSGTYRGLMCQQVKLTGTVTIAGHGGGVGFVADLEHGTGGMTVDGKLVGVLHEPSAAVCGSLQSLSVALTD